MQMYQSDLILYQRLIDLQEIIKSICLYVYVYMRLKKPQTRAPGAIGAHFSFPGLGAIVGTALIAFFKEILRLVCLCSTVFENREIISFITRIEKAFYLNSHVL